MYLSKKTILSSFLPVIITLSCSTNAENKSGELSGYNLDKPYTLKLKSELDEISGILYYNKDTSLFAIQDETGTLYKIYLNNNPMQRWKFSAAADYEDVTLADSTFYILQSKGNIHSFKVTNGSIISTKLKSNLEGKNEFETLYYDEAARKLVLICKDCETDNKKTVSAFAYDLADKTFSTEPFFTLDVNAIDKKLGAGKVKFKPSSAAIHPITKELYILSSVNKALVIASRNGSVKNAVSLDPRLFKQPEGITFSPNGDLYISNEAAGTGAANIQVYKYKSDGR